MGLVASRHVDQIRVPCIERWILNYWTIGEVSLDLFFNLLICLLLLFGCTASSLRLSGFSLVAESGGCFLAAERGFQAHGLQWSHHVAQQLWHTCLVVPLHGESSWTGAEPVSLALGRRILIHWTTGEVFHGFLNRHRYDCLPLAPRIYVYPPRLPPFKLSRVSGFPDSSIPRFPSESNLVICTKGE